MKFPVIKEVLTRVGAHLSPGALHLVNGLFNYLHAGWWLENRGLKVPKRYDSREDLYRALAPQLVEPLTYLEFGVFEGASIRCWSGLLTHPETVFHGFDSFEGLPEDWRMAANKTTFDVRGRLPQIDDSRVSFFKGWFNDVLPGYLQTSPPIGRLVVHLDADIYSSTIYVLKQLSPFLIPGTVLIFDEFFDREHELRALEEYLGQSKLELECLGATRTLTQVAFRILKSDSAGS